MQISLSPEAQSIIRDLDDTGWLLQAVAAGMDKANGYTTSKIFRDRLTGVGPFPVAEHRLGIRSEELRKALSYSKATISGTTVDSSIGDSVKYARIHEFGGIIKRQAKEGTVRLRTNARGELLRQSRNTEHGTRHGAVFASSEHKRYREVAYKAEAYEINMPARAPIQTGIEDSLPMISAEISRAVVDAWSKRK